MAKQPPLFEIEISSLGLQAAQDSYVAQLRLRNPLYYLGQAALATGAAATGNGLALIPGILTVLRSTVGALARKPSTPHLAFELVGRAFYEASGRILEQQKKKTVIRPDVLPHLRQQQAAVSLTVTIPFSFFTNTLEAPFVSDFHRQLRQWLMDYCQYSESMAQIRTALFKSYFLEALHTLWQTQPERYKPVLEALNTPFAEQLKQVYRRRVYAEKLKGLVHESALGNEKLSLKKIYIRPAFHFYKNSDYQQRTEEESEKDFSERKEDLHQYLLQKVIHQNDALNFDHCRLVVLLGQPGQGKTSCCSYFVEEALKEPHCPPLYLIKFRDLESVGPLLQAPFDALEEFLTKKTKIKAPFEPERLVLVLDGLDELYMSNGLQNNNLKELYRLIRKRLDHRPQWTIVLTSRYHYLQINDLKAQQALILKLAPLALEQQKDWLSIYKQAHPNTLLDVAKLVKINESQDFLHVKELIQQPILLHIVAKSNINVSARDSRSTLYQQLFDQLIAKNTEQGRNDTFVPLKEQHHRKQYLSWLQEVAYTIYQSDQLYITQSNVEQLPSTRPFLQAHQPSIKTAPTPQEAFKDLMVSFYFKEASHQQAYAVEFLHKSLQEYMVVAYCLEQLAKRFPISSHASEQINALELLKDCSEWFGGKQLTPILRELLVEQINLWSVEQR